MVVKFIFIYLYRFINPLLLCNFIIVFVVLMSICVYRGSVVQVEWSPSHETIFATSATDKRLIIWDLNRYLLKISMQKHESFFWLRNGIDK